MDVSGTIVKRRGAGGHGLTRQMSGHRADCLIFGSFDKNNMGQCAGKEAEE
ncbi:MAG: hypothetical protein WCK89_13735 [bacterium]